MYYIEKKKWVKYTWIALFVLLDALPRIFGQFFYTTSIKPSGICVLHTSKFESLVKTALDTLYIGIVAVYFTFKIFKLIQPANGGIGVQSLESLTVTSVAFAIALCLIRTVIGIPFILDIWPAITPYLIPLEMILLPPICFLSIAYGSKLRVNIVSRSSTRSMEMKSFRSNMPSSYVEPQSPYVAHPRESARSFNNFISIQTDESTYPSYSSQQTIQFVPYDGEPQLVNSQHSIPPVPKRSNSLPQYF